MTCVQVILSKNFNSTNMVEEKDKHECNKKLIDEGNEEEEQESKIFLKKGIIRRISQLSEWNV